MKGKNNIIKLRPLPTEDKIIKAVVAVLIVVVGYISANIIIHHSSHTITEIEIPEGMTDLMDYNYNHTKL